MKKLLVLIFAFTGVSAPLFCCDPSGASQSLLGTVLQSIQTTDLAQFKNDSMGVWSIKMGALANGTGLFLEKNISTDEYRGLIAEGKRTPVSLKKDQAKSLFKAIEARQESSVQPQELEN